MRKVFSNRWAALLVVGYILSLVMATGCSLSGGVKHQAGKAVQWPHQASDLKPDPDLVFGVLPNGFRYILAANDHPSQRVSMHLCIGAGSLYETDQQQGIAHLLEHMMFNGTTHFPPGKMVEFFQRIGMQFGPDANAHTGFDRTVYDLVLPRGDAESIEEGLLVLRDYAEGALLLDKEIKNETKVVLAEKRTRDSAAYRTFKARLAFEFAGTLVADRLPIGKEQVLKNADSKLLKQFYDTWYRPEKMVLVAVGDFDLKQVEHLVRDSFSSLKGRAPARPEPNPGRVHHDGLEVFYHHEPEVGKTSISIETIVNLEDNSDNLRQRKEELLRDMAAWIIDRRLQDRLNRPEAAFTEAWTATYDFLKRYRLAQIGAQCAAEKWQATLADLEQTLRAGLSFGITPEELERAKKQWLAALDEAVKQSPTRKSRQWAREILAELGRGKVILSPSQQRDLLSPLVKAATVEDVNQALAKMWSASHRLVVVTGNLDLGRVDQARRKIAAVWHNSAQTPVRPMTDQARAVFPYLKFEPAASVVAQKQVPDLGLLQVELSNGVYLNLKKTDYEAGTVAVNIAFGSGLAGQPRQLPGLARLAEEVINESGFGSLDKQALERALAGKNADFSFQVKEDHFLLSGRATVDEAELLCQLMATFFLDPGFRQQAYQLARQRFRLRLQKLAASPEGMLLLKGRQFLAGGDSRFGLPHWKRFSRLTLDEVEKWLRPAIARQVLEVSVVGDIDPDKMVLLARRYFGALPARHSLVPAAGKGPFFPCGDRLAVKVASRIPKALLVIAYPTEDFWNIGRTRRLSLLAEVFSERLRVKVREQLGVSYSPVAFNRSFRAYPGYGLLQAFIQIAPEQAGKVEAAVKKIAADLAAGGISQDELLRARDPVLTSIRDMRQTNSYWLDSVLTGCTRYPQQLDWSRSIEADYAAITVQDINRLARQYLDNARAAVFVALPEAGPQP